jgi:hypothetical protein
MFPKTPHAILLLREAKDGYMGERFLLKNTDAVKSSQRIEELGHFINDVKIALEALENLKD